MMILQSIVGVFVVTFLGMFFLIGEMFVKLKGLGLILGIGFITLYFMSHVSSFNLIMMGIAFLIGIGLIIVDGKFIGDGTIGIVGFVLILLSVAFAASNWTLAMYSVAGVILGSLSSLLLIKMLPRRDMWSKIALMDQLTSEKGYNSLNHSYKDLLNKEGITQTVLRPSGNIKVNGEEYSAVSKGNWIEKNHAIRIVNIDGTKIEVEEVNKE
ncbi:nodulation protein NfeD [Filobacillus milosensis]|uniref:Nodulation protein NfeD n=1 Tax=Filobacillus milosensis TaxID=94137 RepID=A0A4Y8ITD7_9BACI|nr:NfeD family protein [Filobacillus milosensis]TFB25124.1 nodulation protein NfeD [Filobacillus milosensis]